MGVSPIAIAPPPPAPAKPLPIGGQIREPIKIRHVNPIYPQMAQIAKVSGDVILEAVIGTDGSVTNLRVLRSISMLDNAALEAVRQWRFRPTLLNGTPVAVSMTVTVTFRLQ
jgi:protein TonB